jgi:hypothetical protein
MDLAEYYKSLESHDWYYNYSDDHRAWSKGSQESTRLQSIAQENPTLLRMYKDYSNWVHMGVEARHEMHKPELKDYTN